MKKKRLIEIYFKLFHEISANNYTLFPYFGLCNQLYDMQNRGEITEAEIREVKKDLYRFIDSWLNPVKRTVIFHSGYLWNPGDKIIRKRFILNRIRILKLTPTFLFNILRFFR